MPLSFRYFNNDGFKDLIDFTQKQEQEIKEQSAGLGEETAAKMKEVIKANKVRPQSGEPTTLEDTINVEHLGDGSWGVGDIDLLNEKAKYWRAVNYGSNHMVGKHLPSGLFSPDSGDGSPDVGNSRQGRWKTPGSHSPIVKRPIPAMNYIEKTIAFLRDKFAAIRMR